MKAQYLFEYLQGEWKISRSVFTNKSTSPKQLYSKEITGSASVTKKTANTLVYKENLQVQWSNGTTNKAYKEYQYIICDNQIGLYNNQHGEFLLMFNILLHDFHNAYGKYKCNQDTYEAHYRFIHKNLFSLIFDVAGPDKSYSIKSIFTKNDNNQTLLCGDSQDDFFN